MSRRADLAVEAGALAARTRDAYARDRYAERSWRACCLLLLRRGLGPRLAEEALRSRVMRVAADLAGRASGATSRDLARYLDDGHAGPAWAHLSRREGCR